MSKFRDLAKLLGDANGPLGEIGPVAMKGAFRPMDCPPHEWFEAVHDSEYYRAFLAGTLTDKAMRKYVSSTQFVFFPFMRRTKSYGNW